MYIVLQFACACVARVCTLFHLRIAKQAVHYWVRWHLRIPIVSSSIPVRQFLTDPRSGTFQNHSVMLLPATRLNKT